MKSTPLWGETIAEGLARVNDCIQGAVQTGDALIDEVAGYLLSRGGKRLRPALTLLAADTDDDAAVQAAAAVELIHVASLHHDDVIDRSDRRRGDLSVNARWGSHIAVLAGTHLFACAGRLLTSLGDEAVLQAGKASDDLHTGLARETENNYNVHLSQEEYLSILTLKTVSLFQLALGLGSALHRDAETRTPVLFQYGEHLGLAFQLVDDVLDLTGDAATMGKDVGDDIDTGVYSLPVLMTLATPAYGPRLSDILSREGLTPAEHMEIRDIVLGSGAVDEVRQMAVDRAHRAVAASDELPDSPDKKSFQRIAEFAVARVA
ncbi:MAG: polyprenyl synthetase family protein [Myxococcota bacterium]|nr:polyprenyl synthetase family protein [Myxococcota bacterium]